MAARSLLQYPLTPHNSLETLIRHLAYGQKVAVIQPFQ